MPPPSGREIIFLASELHLLFLKISLINLSYEALTPFPTVLYYPL